MKKLSAAILCLAFAHGAVAAQVAPKRSDAAASTPALRQKTFEKAWEIVRDEFYDPNFNGVDWNKTRERYAPLVAAVKTDAELYELLNKMLSELKVSHMGVVTPDALKASAAPPVTTGLGLRNVEGRGVIPNLEVNLTRAGLLQGVDAQLDAALRYIKSHPTPKGNR